MLCNRFTLKVDSEVFNDVKNCKKSINLNLTELDLKGIMVNHGDTIVFEDKKNGEKIDIIIKDTNCIETDEGVIIKLCNTIAVD